MNTYFQFVECAAGDGRLALTGEEHCWEHLLDRDAFTQKILERGRAGESLAGWVLADVDFSGADCGGFDFSSACLVRCDFRGANLAGANLQRVNLDSARLDGADLSGADCEFAILGRANLTGANLQNANLRRSNLVGTIAREANCNGAKFYYSRPGAADFSGVTFHDAEIQRAIFRKAKLVNADLTSAIGQANFENADLSGAKR